jgi:hypothetical protein
VELVVLAVAVLTSTVRVVWERQDKEITAAQVLHRLPINQAVVVRVLLVATPAVVMPEVMQVAAALVQLLAFLVQASHTQVVAVVAVQ